MKRILALVVAPLMVSAAFNGSALAGGDAPKVESGTGIQIETDTTAGADADADGDIGIDADADAELETDLDTGTTAGTGAQANFGSVISAIQASGSAASDVEAATDASNVEIVRMSDIAEGESMNAMDNALEKNQAEVDQLRSAIEANAAVSHQLEQEQVQLDDVLAAKAQADGSLVVYVRQRVATIPVRTLALGPAFCCRRQLAQRHRRQSALSSALSRTRLHQAPGTASKEVFLIPRATWRVTAKDKIIQGLLPDRHGKKSAAVNGEHTISQTRKSRVRRCGRHGVSRAQDRICFAGFKNDFFPS